MKLINKKTGEEIDLSPKKEQPKSPQEKTQERIQERGKIQDSIKRVATEKSGIKKAIAVSEVVDAPFAAIESAIANPSLEFQKGNFNPQNAVKEAILGLSLQKQGQYGDVMKNAGYNPVIADTLGLVLHLSPVKVYTEVSKTFGAISKLSDKAMLKAGDNLLDAVNQAKTAAGTKVTEEFAKHADSVPVDGFKFIEDISKLPEPVMKRAEIVFGDLADFANGLTVGKVREFKRFLGKVKPNSYGQAERGIQENLDVQDLNKVYSNLKTRMESTLSDAASGVDKKTVQYLMKLEEAYSEVVDAGRYIRKQIVDPTLEVPSKVGQFAKKVVSDEDMSGRIALTKIKKTSGEAMKRINSAMKQIESFNSNQKIKQVAGRAINTAIWGGAVGGAAGGSIARRIRESE